MTSTRITLYVLGLLALALLMAGYYSYQNFPALVEEQARQYFKDYGVKSVRYDDLEISSEQLRAGTLHLQGVYQGLAYDAKFSSLAIHFKWQLLRRGRVESASVDELVLDLTEKEARATPGESIPLAISDLLPRSYIEALPVTSIDIERWALTYQPLNFSPFSAQGSLHLQDQIQIEISATLAGTQVSGQLWTQGRQTLPRAKFVLSDGLEEVSHAAIALNPGSEQAWKWTAGGLIYYGPLVEWVRRVSQENDLAIDTATLEGLELAGSTEFELEVEHPETLQTVDSLEKSPLSLFNFKATTKNSLEQLVYPGIVTSLAGDLDIAFDSSGGKLTLSIGPSELHGELLSALLALPENGRKWLRWSDTLAFNWRNPGTVTIKQIDNDGWSIKLDDNLLTLGNADSQLLWEQLNLTASIFPRDKPGVNAQLASRLSTRLRKEQLPQMKVNISQRGSLEESNFKLSLGDVAESMNFALQGEANLLTGQGKFEAAMSSGDLAYASETIIPLLKKFALLGKREILEISQGTLSYTGEWRSEGYKIEGLKQHSKLNLNTLAGVYDEYSYEGMSLQADWAGVEKFRTTEPVKLGIAKLDIGFDLMDTEMVLSVPKATPLDEPLINIDSLTSDVFGGRVFLPEAQRWDFGAPVNRFTVRAEGWQLADMVALQKGQDIRAQGTLEGQLPVTVTDGRIIIANGFLRAVAPGGSIRYVANESSLALAQSSSEFALALDLLSDFQYEVLSTAVELDAGGNLVLGLSLQGKNPSLFEGQPVNFNINLEQNLDPLLQSLRLSDKLVKKLEERIK